ncbi:hypothetical protein BH10PSE14_BH10PSE14_27500 [soil metagenome]
MRRAIILAILATCAGAAFAQDGDDKIRNGANYQSHRPLGSNELPVPYDPKDQVDFGRPAERRGSHAEAGYSEQDQYGQRTREWRRMQERRRDPLGVNLSGDADARGYVPPAYSTRRYNSTTQPSADRSSSYGSSTYSTPPLPRYRPPSTYGEAVRRDNSWLRPNFGTPPSPAPAPTYRPAPEPTHRTMMQCLGNLQARC